MQIHDDQSDRLSNASDISKSSALETSSLKGDADNDADDSQTLENEGDVTSTTVPVTDDSVAPELAQEAGNEADSGEEEDEDKEDVRESDV